MTEALTFDVYNYTCLGLFEKHKLMFSFQMTIKVLEGGSQGSGRRVGWKRRACPGNRYRACPGYRYRACSGYRAQVRRQVGMQAWDVML